MNVQSAESDSHALPSYKFSREALAIEEILGHIMLFADNGSKASSMQVCKHWFECTVKQLWENINVHISMRLLGPFRVTKSLNTDNEGTHSIQTVRFSCPILPDHWKRFSMYAAHVKIIMSRADLDLTDAVSAMARSRRVLYMFPNLYKIIWNAMNICQLTDSIPYMSPQVTAFGFSLNEAPQDGPILEGFYRETASRMPQLKILSIATSFETSALRVPLALLIKELKFLEKYVCEICTLTTPLFLALSGLPRLQIINGSVIPPTHAQIADVETLEPEELIEGAFPSLEHLMLSTNFRNIARILEHPHRPQSLLSLACDSIHHEFPEDIRYLLVTIAATCPMLKSLFLGAGAYIPETPHGISCNFDSLRPILQCRSLTSLDIMDIVQLELAEEDMDQLARDRDTWTRIVVSDPSLRPTLGLSAIIPFMRYCPHLKTLGLFLNGDSAIPEIENNNTVTRPHPLTTLKLGKPPISEESADAVALFLARICVRPVKIKTDDPGNPVWRRVQNLHSRFCDVLQMHMENAKKWRRG